LLFADTSVGFAVRDRAHVDKAGEWTMVSHAAFSKDDEIREIEVFSGAAGRRLRIGIYKPSGGQCQFQLVQQKEWTSIPVGYKKV
jgi:hypothetical protein